MIKSGGNTKSILATRVIILCFLLLPKRRLIITHGSANNSHHENVHHATLSVFFLSSFFSLAFPLMYFLPVHLIIITPYPVFVKPNIPSILPFQYKTTQAPGLPFPAFSIC